MQVEDRFWSKVDVRGPDECWEWTGSRHPQGYGTFKFGTSTRYAHRVAWLLATGVEPADSVLHTCDNPPCVNKRHLFEGTHDDNMVDCATKGRNRSQKQTHCPAGHPYDDANTYRGTQRTKRGAGPKRACRACARIRTARKSYAVN